MPMATPLPISSARDRPVIHRRNSCTRVIRAWVLSPAQFRVLVMAAKLKARSQKCHKRLLPELKGLLKTADALGSETALKSSRPRQAKTSMKTDNQTAVKAARFAAASVKAKLTAAEREGAEAKATVLVAKAAYKKAKKSLKQARKEAKAARKAIVQVRESAGEADQKLRKAQKKASQARRAAKAKTQAASKPARSVAGTPRKTSAASTTGNARVMTARTSGTAATPEEHIVMPGEEAHSGSPV